MTFQALRFSVGRGVCPGLGERAKIADRLQPGRIGVELSEEFPLHSEQFRDAIVVRHSEAKHSVR